MSNLPDWAIYSPYQLRRAEKSVHENNHATEEKTSRSIIIYDSFFRENDQMSIIVHEISHGLYDRLLPAEMNEFSNLSGWTLQVDQMKVYELPPKVLIKPDSALNVEEDFANHAEEYFKHPSAYEKKFPALYLFFRKRLKP